MSIVEQLRYDSIDNAVGGYHLAQLAIGVLGVMVITGEYSTGMIRSSLMAVPHRLPVLWAKAVVFAAVTFVLMLVSAFVAFFVVQAIATAPPRPALARRSARAARGRRRGAVPDRPRAAVGRARRADPQHRRRDRGVRVPALRAPRDHRDPAGEHERRDPALPPAQRGHDGRHEQRSTTAATSAPGSASRCSAATPRWRSAPGRSA